MIGRTWFWIVGLSIAVSTTASAGTQEFERAVPGKTFSFPQDHYSHPEFQTEWWYYTGHVKSRDGESFGYQLTFFRTGLRRNQLGKSTWALHTVYFAHFALTDETRKTFTFREKISRGALGQAGAARDRLEVWVDDWSLKGEGMDHVLEARDASMAIRFRLSPLKRPVVNGLNGVSQKAEGEGYASHYYSITRMKTEGELIRAGKKMTVEGISWMDHEFGSNQLREYQVGWDWFSLQLENGIDLMLYVIRHEDGKPDPYSSGTLVFSDGSAQHLPLAEFTIHALETWNSRKSSGRYPSKWRIQVPESDISLTVTPTVSDQELVTQQTTRVTYWEGSARVEGTYKGRPVTGMGYVELTGYAEPFGAGI
jgi:predicted secreted hydrolase